MVDFIFIRVSFDVVFQVIDHSVIRCLLLTNFPLNRIVIYQFILIIVTTYSSQIDLKSNYSSVFSVESLAFSMSSTMLINADYVVGVRAISAFNGCMIYLRISHNVPFML